MINFKYYATKIGAALFFLFIITYLSLNETNIDITSTSGFEESNVPEALIKNYTVNLLALSMLVIILFIISITPLINFRYGVYILFILAPLTRQIELINTITGKILPVFIILAFLIKEKFRIPAIKFPHEIRVYIFLLITGIVLSTIYNGVSFIPLVRQIIFFILIYVIYASVLKGYVRSIHNAVFIAGLILIIDIISNSMLAGDMFSMFNQTGSFFNNQTAAGTLLYCALPFYYVINKRARVSSREIIPHGLIAALFIVTSLLTGSRGSSLGIMLFLIFYHVNIKSYLRFFILLVSMLFIFALVIQIPLVYEILRIDNPLSQRDILIVLGFNAVLDNPIFGIGPGGFSNLALNYGNEAGIVDLVKGGIFGGSSHNVYIDAYLDAGIIGFFALLYLYINLLKNSHSNLHSTKIQTSFLKSYIIISFFGSKVILGGSVTEGLLIWTIIIILPALNSIDEYRIKAS